MEDGWRKEGGCKPSIVIFQVVLSTPPRPHTQRPSDAHARRCVRGSVDVILTTGNHDPRYRVLRVRFECRVRTAKSPARGPEWTDPHEEARPAIASAGPCIMIFGRRYERIGPPLKPSGIVVSPAFWASER